MRPGSSFGPLKLVLAVNLSGVIQLWASDRPLVLCPSVIYEYDLLPGIRMQPDTILVFRSEGEYGVQMRVTNSAPSKV